MKSYNQAMQNVRVFCRSVSVILALLLGGVCNASESPVVIIYQPIIMESEAHPKGLTGK